MNKYVQFVAWAWMIIVGGLLIILPHGPILCLVCGGPPTFVIGLITVILAIAGFSSGRSGPAIG